MDLLMECARSFEQLLLYKYNFTIGRKGKSHQFVLEFDKSDFHHLVGLHKMNVIAQSVYYEDMKMRLKPLIHLEEFLDTNNLIFRYNEKVHKFSVIKADYLLESQYQDLPVYLFLGQRNNSGVQMCRTFFPKGLKDYTVGQPQYTLLKKEKVHVYSGNVEVQYDRLTPKE